MLRARMAALAPLYLTLGGAAPRPPSNLPDVIEAGRVAAQLSDWQTITYFLVFLLTVQTVERWIAGWQARATSRQLADAIDKLADALAKDSGDIKVNLALIHSRLGDHGG